MGGVVERAEREESEHDFIGQVFSKASPILTWRPVKVQRITPAPPESGVVQRANDLGFAEASPDASAQRVSRATTRRMVAWPVVRRVERGAHRGRAVRALFTLVAFSLLCGSALTLCVYVLLGEGQTAWHPKAPSVRVAVTHIADESFDTLLPPPAPLATAEPRPTPPPQRGRAHHGHRKGPGASHRTT